VRRSDRLLYLSFFPKTLFHDDHSLLHRYILFNDLDAEYILDQEVSGFCPECRRFTVWKGIENEIFGCRNCRLQAHVDQIARWSIRAYFETEEKEDNQEQ